jgi:hypothetical protein
MVEIVNLNRARKDRARTAAKATAVENRAKFGRGKGEKAKTVLEQEQARRRLDEHERE